METKEALQKIAREKAFNDSLPVKERWQACMALLENANDRLRKIKSGIESLQRYSNSLVMQALNEYKKEKLSKFIAKWDGKQPCEEMLKEMEALEKPNHCYKFSGIVVIEEDCNLCKSSNCKKSIPKENFFELLYGIESEDTDIGDIPEIQEAKQDADEMEET